MVIQRQDYAGPADLRRMQALIQRRWSPYAQFHIGDLAWGRFMHAGREREWPTALWTVDGDVRAWGWRLPPAELYLAIDPGFPQLVPLVLDWFAAVAPRETPRTVPVTAGNEALGDGLRAAGYRPDERPEQPFFIVHHRWLADLPPVIAPPGYQLRPVTAGEVVPRAGVHAAAFAPSRVTPESYANVIAAWPYQAGLDWVAVEERSGDLTAFCLIWPDPVNLVGELEPVGTHPEHRRRGLGRAVCLSALHALRATGANRAIVLSRGDAAGLAAQRLYASLGFRPVTRIVDFRLDPPAAGAGG